MTNIKNIHIAIVLTLLTFARAGVILSSNTECANMMTSDPVYENQYNYGGRLNIPGAQVLWCESDWRYVEHGKMCTFVQHFKPYCDGEIIISAAADNEFQINVSPAIAPNPVLSGNDINKVYKVSARVKKCQKYELRVKATNYHHNTPAGVIYQVEQPDQSCMDCPPGSYFNTETCSCECLRICPCDTFPWIKWYDYPDCACGCFKKQQCKDGYFFNEKTCQCQCLNYKMCRQNQHWSIKTCQCECRFKLSCRPPLRWDENVCSCVADR